MILKSCSYSLLDLMLGSDFIFSSPLGLTSGLSFSSSRLIFKLVPILKLGDDISILLIRAEPRI